jgi:hypothetical protein
MQAEYSVLYASVSDLAELASLALNASLPSGFVPVSDAVTVKPVTNPFISEDGSLHWTMRAERRLVQNFDPAQITRLVQGFGVEEARSNLEKNLPPASSPEIELSPSWWRWVPLLPFRIEVVTR